MKFLVVGIDYFTKWVEAEPLAKITEHNIKSFVWKNIICVLESLKCLSQTTDASLTIHHSKSFVSN